MKTPPLALIGSFLAFGEARNMTEAASSLGLSQPALTHHLQDFARYFSQDVFALEGRKKVLTPYGRELYGMLKTRFGPLETDLKILDEKFQSPEQVRLNIAGRREILNLWAARLRFPGTLAFHPVDGATAVEGLLKRDFDLALSNHLAKAAHLHGKKIFSDQFVIMIPKTWKIDVSLPLPALLERLGKHPLAAYKDEDPLIEKLWGLAKEEGPRSPITKIVADWPTLRSLATAGQAWTLMPTPHLTPETGRVDTKPVPFPETQFYLLYRKELVSRPWFAEFAAQFQKSFDASSK